MEIKHLPHSHKHGTQYHHFGNQDHPSHARHSKGRLVDRALHPHSGNTTNVAIAGVTGQLGQLIVKHLLDNEGVTIHGIARNPEKLSNDLKNDSRVKLFKTNMTDETSIREAVKHCSILISVIRSDPSTEVALQKTMVDACVAEKVHRFVPNDFSLDWRGVNMDLIPQMKVKREMSSYLEAQKGKVKGVHILTGAFMECQFSGGFLYPPDKSPAEGLSAWGTGDEIIELTSYDNVARWTAEIALNREAEGFFQFLGDRQSPKEVAKALEERYDLPPVPFTSKGSLEDLKKELQAGLENDRDSDDFWAWMGQSYSYFLSNGQAYLPTPLDNRRYLNWVEQETLEDWLLDKNIEDLSKTGRV